MITYIDHIVLTSKDIYKTISFTAISLEWNLKKIQINIKVKIVYLKFGSQKININ